MQCVRNCDDPRRRQHFEQPVIQTAQMFIGEMGCWIVVAMHNIYKRLSGARDTETRPHHHTSAEDPSAADPLLPNIDSDDERDDSDTLNEDEDPLASSLVLPHDGRKHLEGWKVVYLALPACCDIAGTTLMNVGLLFVAASIYQMTRGALVLFVGLFSVLFLKHHLSFSKWMSLFIVVAGVALVGLAGVITKDDKATPRSSDGDSDVEIDYALRTVVGVLLIAAAQIFTAAQFVLEENIMARYSTQY